METALDPPDLEKSYVDILRHGRTRVHYVSCRSHRMEKLNFGVTCPGALFVISLPVPPNHEKKCVNILLPIHTGMQYMTRRSHLMHKHMFSKTCPVVVFVISVPVAPEREK
jgi:hypothetical protein